MQRTTRIPEGLIRRPQPPAEPPHHRAALELFRGERLVVTMHLPKKEGACSSWH